MFSLIKYEWLRRWKFFLAGVIIFIAANVDIVSRLVRQENPRTLTAILMGLVFAMALALFFDHIGRLYRSLFNDEGYLEFTLPLRGYQLLGGKLLAVIVECIGLMLFVLIIGYLDLQYLLPLVPENTGLSLPPEIIMDIVQAVALILTAYIMFLLTIYLSMTLSKTVFASFKHGKLIAFGCFVAISKVIEMIVQQAKSPFEELPTQVPELLFTYGDWLTMAAIIIVLFLSTTYLLDKRINL